MAPREPMAHFDLANVCAKLGRTNEALSAYSKALELQPDNPETHQRIAELLEGSGAGAQALAHYQTAARSAAVNPELHRKVALLLDGLGRKEEALEEFSTVARLKPQDASAHYELAISLARNGKREQAVEPLRASLRLKADSVAALNNLAWILATDPKPDVRKGEEAVELAIRACELTGYKDPRIVGTLDAAYAEAGRFAEAISTAEQARKLAETAGRTDIAKAAQVRLELYRSGQPYHEPEQGKSPAR